MILGNDLQEEIKQLHDILDSSFNYEFKELSKYTNDILSEDDLLNYEILNYENLLRHIIEDMPMINSNRDNEEIVKIKSTLLMLAMNKVNINELHCAYINLNVLDLYKDLLFNHPINPIDPKKFLELTLIASTEIYDSVSKKFISDKNNIELQSNLIKIAADNGANINDQLFNININVLYDQYETLLTLPNNQLTQENFLELIYNRLVKIINIDNKNSADEVYINKKASLIELTYKNANNSLPIKEIQPLELGVINALSIRGIIDDKSMLKIALNTENNYYYLEKHQFLQHQLVEYYLAKVSIEDFSFNELNIAYNHISILELLLASGLDPRALILHLPNLKDSLEVLSIALKNNVKINALTFINALGFYGVDLEIYKALLGNLASLNDKFTARKIIDDFCNQGPKFKEYFYSVFKNEDIAEKAIKETFTENGTVLHILTKVNNPELLKFVLENHKCDINALNDAGQTPLFFASNTVIAEILIDHQPDLNIKDKNGNYWINNPSLGLIEYAIEHHYLSEDHAKKAALNHFSKGNYEYAAKLYKMIDSNINIDPVGHIVDCIMNGLQNSVENNKYQAILNLINKAGIKIPREFEYLLNSYRDDHKIEEFKFIYGLIHKLAFHYINLSKNSLEKTLGTSIELDNAFNNFDFAALKIAYPDNLELAKITDPFSAYYQVVGKALNILDNDFTLEVLTINGLRPNRIKKEVTVYRGIHTYLGEDDIDSYFKFGHRAYSIGEYQKLLGFYVNQDWNEIEASVEWEYGGTYFSFEAIVSSGFAGGGMTSFLSEAKNILLEVQIPEDYPEICGSWKEEYELLTATIIGENIVAIYVLDRYENETSIKYRVSKLYKNPYIDEKITPNFRIDEEIDFDHSAKENYNDLNCKNLPTVNSKSGLYKNYQDFIETYKQEDYEYDQEKLTEDYFSDRDQYIEEFNFGISCECDLSIQCC